MEALAFLPSVIVVGAVLKQSKNVSALAQLGSVAGRAGEMDGLVRDSDDSSKKQAVDAEAEKIKDIDKLTFTLSAFNIGMTCFWFGRWPQTFYLWHIPKVSLKISPPPLPSPPLACWNLSSMLEPLRG